MRRSSSPWFALFCAFFLLFAQGAAYAHWVGHLGSDARHTLAETADAGGKAGDHGSAESLCLSCLAYASIAAAPPSTVVQLVSLAIGHEVRTDSPARQATSQPYLPYAARAPPIRL